MRGALVVMVVLAGCYRPAATASCVVSCAGGCPSGLTCETASGLCKDPALAGTCDPDGGVIDAVPDVALDCTMYGSPASLAHVCLRPDEIGGSIILPTGTIDTAAGTACMLKNTIEGTPVCVIAAQTLSWSATGATLHAKGTRPLVLVATVASVTINGVLDVSSTTLDDGAGANPAATCTSTAGGDSPSTAQGAGGGAGGSFSASGGFGGIGGNNGGGSGTPGPSIAIRFTGGCKGARGGSINASSDGGAAGSGGGAVYVIAATQVTILGKIWANGRGGGGAQTTDNGYAGGGGGGAGGFIGLDAPMITLTGSLSADGGGGGGGAGAPGAPGMSGGVVLAAGNAASGGAGANNAGNGGFGSAGKMGSPGDSVTGLANGAGGGGGGAGYIKVTGLFDKGTSVVSPSPTM